MIIGDEGKLFLLAGDAPSGLVRSTTKPALPALACRAISCTELSATIVI
jgi:hypothetical protein